MNRKQRRAAAKAQARGVAGSPRIDQLLTTAVSHQQAGRLTEARALCSQILIQEPRHAVALHLLGYMTFQQGNPLKALRITDKLPINFKYIGLIHLCLPHARIIHCRRDAVDTCFSCFKMRFTNGLEFSYDLADLGRNYRLYERLMDHWQAVLPGKLLDLSYEDMVDNLETSARRMVEFCGLDWDENCLEFHKTERAVMTASDVQVRRPIYNTSIGLWRRYEQQLAPLLEALGRS